MRDQRLLETDFRYTEIITLSRLASKLDAGWIGGVWFEKLK